MPRILRLFAVVLALGFAACASHQSTPDFTLTDQHGKQWSLWSQRGAPMVLYFGFTHCPDTCPTTLAKLTKALAPIPGARVVFVTLDPERDTAPVLAAFVSHFDGAPIVALTGTRSQIDRVQSAYHVWSQKMPGMHGKGGYDIAHTSLALVIARDGAERETLQENQTIEQIRRTVERASE